MSGASGSGPPGGDAPPATARPAASLAVLRIGPSGAAEALFGQRGGGAAFMPSKVVFPGGALDPEDARLAETLSDPCDARLEAAPDADAPTGAPAAPAPTGAVLARALALSAIRETFEETGLRLGRRGGDDGAAAAFAAAGEDWSAFAADGARPSFEALGFFFRAITPPFLPRRFDARLFVAWAGDLMEDEEDFSRASGELAPLFWTPLAEAADLDLPFVTHLAVAELASIVAEAGAIERVAAAARARPAPFFRHAAAPDGDVRAVIEPL
ncbi:MAG: DNA mismatch repair protein MutT [Pseudomonadota bacterium]